MNKPGILITGSKGQLGQSIKQISNSNSDFKWYFTDIEELDITDEEALNNFAKNKSIQYLVNCAAYTAVDAAETDTDNAYKINALAPELLAKLCAKKDIKFIHISTDYVFDGSENTPYSEQDELKPMGVYGISKLAGEAAATKALPESIIIRTSWLYSEYGKNFVRTMLYLGEQKDSLNVIFDQTGTPTYAGDLAKAIIRIIENNFNTKKWIAGVYHFSNQGVCSWYDFATEIMRKAKLSCNVFPIETYEYPTPAKRPHYSVLNKKKICDTYSLNIPHWTTSLHKCIESLLTTK